MKHYVITKDLQGENFNVGFKGTAEEFKNKFKYYLAENPICLNKLDSLEGEEAIKYIADTFELEIKEDETNYAKNIS